MVTKDSNGALTHRFALSYLYRITTNVCLNELHRREYSVRIESLDQPAEDGEGSTVPAPSRISAVHAPDPAEHLVALEMTTEVHKVLNKLPPNQRAAFMLRRVEGLSYHDVARGQNANGQRFPRKRQPLANSGPPRA
jgi:RNA polymerase sigma-70 factor (ECF subfamily)